MAGEGGGEGNRTPVQTYSSKAFYMLILFYFPDSYRDRELTGYAFAKASADKNRQPINSLAVFPTMSGLLLASQSLPAASCFVC